MVARVTQTTPATKWESFSAASLPKVFSSRFPKAVMINSTGNVVMKGSDGNQVTFTLAAGVPIQLRPTEIVSATADPVIVLYD